MLPADLLDLARRLLAAYEGRGWRIATAESCTGGLIAASLTEIAGSSAVVDRGVVTYSNQAKTDLLGVPADLIAAHGAVSEPVARAMALGLLDRSPADVALSVTGIAGPGGGSAAKPVGLVYLGRAVRNGAGGGVAVVVERHVFPGDRGAVRHAAVTRALALGLGAVSVLA